MDSTRNLPASAVERRRPGPRAPRRSSSTGPVRPTARPMRSPPRRPAAPAPQLEAVSPRARNAASAEEWVQPEPCEAPSGWRSPSIAAASAPSKKRSTTRSLWPPVTTTASGPSASTSRARSSCGVPLARPGQRPRLGDVRGDHRRQRQQVARSTPSAPRRRAGPRRSRRPSPGRRRPARPRPARAPRPPPRPSRPYRACRS